MRWMLLTLLLSTLSFANAEPQEEVVELEDASWMVCSRATGTAVIITFNNGHFVFTSGMNTPSSLHKILDYSYSEEANLATFYLSENLLSEKKVLFVTMVPAYGEGLPRFTFALPEKHRQVVDTLGVEYCRDPEAARAANASALPLGELMSNIRSR
ncbi:MAG: hypothetical protein A2284_16510 [Deltaproteobacteria bacterium RIFOXYA12_FULL_61_11]|nr:MAG: hypothetical protein A2284_16510 [Deltaproteobacteria bacterium RIFOXYA12_FULL_61_11]